MNIKEEVSLKQRWADLKEVQSGIRIRNAAKELGVSEVELLATQCGDNVTRLQDSFVELLQEIERLGNVTAITRNDDVVHERKGRYLNFKSHGKSMALFVGADIDLRVFLSCWKSGFAVTEKYRDLERKSLQFFAKDGMAIHKIYLNEDSDEKVFVELVNKYRDINQENFQRVEPHAAELNISNESIEDVSLFHKEWESLKDTHDFYGLLKKYNLSREGALRNAPESFAISLQKDSLRKILKEVVGIKQEVMVFVGNKGMLQIHTGSIERLAERGPWFNVLDPLFNLHVREEAIKSVWAVKKPTADGPVHSFEFFDDKGELILQIFGKRKPGIPEMASWRRLLDTIVSQGKIA